MLRISLLEDWKLGDALSIAASHVTPTMITHLFSAYNSSKTLLPCPQSHLDLKDLIRKHCPATQSWANTPEARTFNKLYNQYPQWFDTCQKSGYAWPEVPSHMRED